MKYIACTTSGPAYQFIGAAAAKVYITSNVEWVERARKAFAQHTMPYDNNQLTFLVCEGVGVCVGVAKEV